MLIITGAAGFVGVNVALEAIKRRLPMILIDDADRYNRYECFGISQNDRIRKEQIDLSGDFRHDLFPRGSTIIHLAALAHVDYSMYFPDEVLRNNVQSTLRILEVARSRQCRLLFASSVEVYGSASGTALTEDACLKPLSPYAASKAAAEVLVRNYLDCFEMEGTIVRFTNLYGPWQLPDRIIPRLIGQSLMNMPSELDPGSARDYLYVQDAVSAIMSIVNCNTWDRLTYNVCSGSSLSNSEIAEQIGIHSNGRMRIANTNNCGKYGRGESLEISPQRFVNRTGWRPNVGLPEGLSRTYDWYARNMTWVSKFRSILSSDRSGPGFLADFAARNKVPATASDYDQRTVA